MLVEAGAAGVGAFLLHKFSIFCEVKLPAFYDALKYVAVERSASRREQAAMQSKHHAARRTFHRLGGGSGAHFRGLLVFQ